MIDDEMERFTEMWAFYNSSPNGILILDEDSKILVANRAMETFTGYSTRELHHMNVSKLIPPGVKNPHADKLSLVIENGAGPRDMKPLSAVPLLRKDGETVKVDVERRVYRYMDERRFAGIVTPARAVLLSFE